MLKTPGGVAAGRATAQATGCQERDHVVDRIQASRVGLEAPADDLGALAINGDGAHLPAVGQRLTDVQIAQGRVAGKATDLDLAADSLFDILGDLDAPGGGYGRHDALKHDAVAGVLADRLLDRDELRAGAVDEPAGGPVILLVARPPADGPHDHEVDVASLSDVGDHLAEHFALDQVTAGYAGLDVLKYGVGTDGGGLALALLPLGRK
ncbi:MAG: hypothetical protein ABSG93_12100 [Solirubrobacteraceae bacterium]